MKRVNKKKFKLNTTAENIRCYFALNHILDNNLTNDALKNMNIDEINIDDISKYIEILYKNLVNKRYVMDMYIHDYTSKEVREIITNLISESIESQINLSEYKYDETDVDQSTHKGFNILKNNSLNNIINDFIISEQTKK